jgi:glycosyltransferase involved in cell wall biosynthesis
LAALFSLCAGSATKAAFIEVFGWITVSALEEGGVELKVVLTTHHFPPRYVAGVELYTYRLARWLTQAGHAVQVICVESIEDESLRPRCIEDVYEGIPVCRLNFQMAAAPDPFRWQFWNPEIGDWFKQFLAETRPDLVHVNSCYLLSASTIAAACKLEFPLVLTLHDFWFLCPRITLQRPNGTLCQMPKDPAECVWCLKTERRRYRLPDSGTRGASGRLAVWAMHRPVLLGLTGWRASSDAMRERRRQLATALSLADIVVAPSRFLEKKFIAHGLSPEKVRFCRYGLDGAMWNSGALARVESEHLRIGYIGQVAAHKGVHLLIQAFKRLDTDTDGGPELRIYGDLARDPRYVRYLKRLADGCSRILFKGLIENRRMPETLAELDVVVAPSTWYENSPLAIMEAQAAQVPVVTSDLGGMAELVQHDVSGLLFRVGNVEDLARQLQRLLDEPRLLYRLRSGIRPVRMIDEEMEELLELYHAARVLHQAGEPHVSVEEPMFVSDGEQGVAR